MSYILKPIYTGLLCLCVLSANAQFSFLYEGPDSLYVDQNCTAILDWGHPATPDVFPTMPGQVIISWVIFSISGGYTIGAPVPAGETVTVFYQARDNMGHISLFGFNLFVVDNTPPEFDPNVLPDDVTVSCANEEPIPTLTFSDNCDPNGTESVLTFEESGNPPACQGGSVVREWTLTDASGNATFHIQEITILPDTSRPVITGFPVDGTAACQDVMAGYTSWIMAQRAAFMADDVGCGIMTLSDNAPDPSVLIGFCGELEVSFFATDFCGNNTSVLASFVVTNTTAPTIAVPATDETVNCDIGNPQTVLQNWLNAQGGAVAVDDCSLVTWTTNPASPSLDDACNGAVSVTFIANDGCGNTASTTADFFIQDNTSPTITAQAQNVIINCSTANFEEELAEWLSTNGNAAATDICTDTDSIQVEFVLEGVTLDSAGVIAAFQDSIMNGSCVDGIIIDGFIFNNVLALIALDFRFVDNCGNASTTPGIFAIRDAVGPTWSVLSQDTILSCIGSDVESLFTMWYESGGFAVGTDDCGSVFFTGVPTYEVALAEFMVALDTACSSGVLIEVAFQLNDFCGNTNATVETATFGIEANSGPVITEEPIDFMFDCSGNVQTGLVAWLDSLGGAQVQQSCGDVAWSFSWIENGDTLTGVPNIGPYPNNEAMSCNSNLLVTFIAADICNQSVSADAAFSFTDTVAPVLTVDAEITIPCDSLEFIAVLISDNCTSTPVISFTDVNMSGDTTQCLNGTITRTWMATDDCGNTTIAVQVINTADTEAPSFTTPEDTIIYCAGVGEIESGIPTNVEDNCDPGPIVSFEDEITGTACDQVIMRRWIVTDACGNESTAIQAISLIDTLPPTVLIAPQDFILECGITGDPEAAFNVWLSSGAGASLMDNCSDAQYFFAEPGTYDLGDTSTWPGTLPLFPIIECGNDTLGGTVVDMVYSDACGNAGFVQLSILILDTTPPVIEGCLTDTIVQLETGECETEITLSPPIGFDLCMATFDTSLLEITQPLTSDIPGDSMQVVDTLSFLFNVNGPPAFTVSSVTIDLTLSGVDADSTTEHFIVYGDQGEILGITGTATSECDTVNDAFIISSEDFNAWSEDGMISLTLAPNTDPGAEASINDICPGATATISMIVIQGIQDSLAYAYAVDTSARKSLDTLQDVLFMLSAGEHDIFWYVTDCAGNEAQCVTQVTVQDIDPPQIACPMDITVIPVDASACMVPVVLHLPESFDTCGIQATTYGISGDTLINATPFEDADSLIAFLDVGTYVVQYIVTDVSGNTAACTFNVFVIDTLAPTAACKPATVFVHPSGVIPLEIDPALIDGGSVDNCRIDSMFVIPAMFPCDSAGTVQQVQLVVIDASGNADTCVAEITIEVQSIIPTFEIGICANDSLHLFANVPPAPGNPYSFSWTGPNGFISSEENPSIPNVNASFSGTYVVVVTGVGGCTTMGTVDVVVEDSYAPVLSLEHTVVCEGDTVRLMASAYQDPVTYRWFRGVAPGGLLLGTSLTTSFTDVPPLPGQYIYYVVVETASCASDPSVSVSVDVIETPIATVTTPFIEVCEGGEFSIGTNISGPNISYQWTGPDGYESTIQIPPAITDVQLTQAGAYSLVISIGGCMSTPATTDVVVAPRPEMPVISGDAVFCEGGNLILTIENVPGADQYIWLNPEMNSISTATNTLTLNNINASLEGNWTVVAMLGDCPSESSLPFVVNIESMLPITASNDGPVCDGSGDSVTLIVDIIPGVEYVWEGPGGFMSNEPTPTVLGVESTYTVTATSSSGCTAISSTTILANDPPAITALSNTSGICADSSQSLTFAVSVFPADIGSYAYAWTGPNGFTSDDMTPVIPGLTSALNGTYTLIISLGSCMSEPVSTVVNVQNAPTQPTVEGVGEYCSGESIVLTAPMYAADSVLYIWNTPTGIVQVWNNNMLVVNNTSVTNSGMYSVIVQIDGCDSQSSEAIQVNVAQVVNQPIVQAPASVCAGESIQLSTQLVPGGIYHWSGPHGFISQLQNPTIVSATASDSGLYTLYVQVGECLSDTADAVNVAVLPLPQSPVVEIFEGSVCLGAPSPITLCIDESSTTTDAVYTWSYLGNPIAPSTIQRCITYSDFSIFTEGTNTIAVSAELFGCASPSEGVIEIPMVDIPEISANAGPDATFCNDDEVALLGILPALGTASWSSNDGAVIFENVFDPFTNVSGLAEGENVLIWTLDFESCLDYSSDMVSIFVEPTPTAITDSILVPFGETVDIDVLLNDLVQGAYTVTLLPGEGPLKGNALYKGDGILTYDPNLGYVGPDRMRYEICSQLCPDQCSQADVIIQVGDETDCFIPTIFTPNGDGTNDRLIIPCLETERFPQNRVAIFNEWGDAVFEAQPYLNDWTGTREGKDLPVATYFYIVDFGDGRPVENGFLILER